MAATRRSSAGNLEVGARFGALVVTSEPYVPDPSRSKNLYVECVCDCGTADRARATLLVSGGKTACRQCSWRKARTIHGDTESVEHVTWINVLARAGYRTDGTRLKRKSKSASAQLLKKRYHERGIDVDPRWFDYATFLSDMGRRPADKWSIERTDNNRGYWPDNCKWATRSEQAGNRSTSILVPFRGKTQCLTAWARELGISYNTLITRYRRGDRDAYLLREPRRAKNAQGEAGPPARAGR